MGQVMTLNIPEPVVTVAQEMAEHTHRRVEDVLVTLLEQATTEPPLEMLPDVQVLALADLQMAPDLQEELSDLLYENSEGTITETQRVRLDEILNFYRKGMVRKAQALVVAVQRGLRPPLN